MLLVVGMDKYVGPGPVPTNASWPPAMGKCCGAGGLVESENVLDCLAGWFAVEGPGGLASSWQRWPMSRLMLTKEDSR